MSSNFKVGDVLRFVSGEAWILEDIRNSGANPEALVVAKLDRDGDPVFDYERDDQVGWSKNHFELVTPTESREFRVFRDGQISLMPHDTVEDAAEWAVTGVDDRDFEIVEIVRVASYTVRKIAEKK